MDRLLLRLAGYGEYFVLLALVALVALFALYLYQITVVPHQQATARYEARCIAAGGHIYNPDGTRFCVRDGLWVEVYP